MNPGLTAEKRALNPVEKTVLTIVFVLMAIGVIAAFVNKTWFLEQYVAEDHFIEDVTLMPLAIITIICFTYLIKFSRKKNVWFVLTYLMIGLASFFVLGEEISWGQRIFNFQTSEFFREHNSQDEENIHNLILDGEKLNKIIFTDALIAVVVIYLIIFPIIYNRNNKFRDFIDRSAFPLPRLYQIIACTLVFGLSFLTFDPKGAELLEFGGSGIFMLIILYPLNKHTLR
jgi:cell division protein FtsW (lipid II flippase)